MDEVFTPYGIINDLAIQPGNLPAILLSLSHVFFRLTLHMVNKIIAAQRLRLKLRPRYLDLKTPSKCQNQLQKMRSPWRLLEAFVGRLRIEVTIKCITDIAIRFYTV